MTLVRRTMPGDPLMRERCLPRTWFLHKTAPKGRRMTSFLTTLPGKNWLPAAMSNAEWPQPG
ncbi:MAG: hypothetical protein AB7P11_04680 [Hydrogenophaga sp.]|uniref:hypothetical protein n=1 Tax=Hydrogenophaga sp. TaxID=1904254 RepID=UPI003D0E954D